MSNDNEQLERLFKLQAKINILVLEGKRSARRVSDHLQLLLDEPARGWRVEGGAVRFSVTSRGRTGEEWIALFESMKTVVLSDAKHMLLSNEFPVTNGITTEVALIRPSNAQKRTFDNIKKDGKKRKLIPLRAEVLCLIREKFSDKDIREMDFWGIVGLHEPIKDILGNPGLLLIDLDHDFGTCLNPGSCDPRIEYGSELGFAFEVPKRREVRPFVG